MNRLRTLWWTVSGSLWFLPSLLVLAAVLAAAGLIELDSRVKWNLASDWPRLFGAGADGARSMLSAIASSMITVAGVVFSVTLVALTLTATQYSSRVIRSFMNDRPTQTVLGAFVAVFAYCLVVLRSIRADDVAGGFVPSIAVFGGMVLALVGIGFLVFFIHHVAVAMEASSILARLTDATLKAQDKLFPADCSADEERDEAGAQHEAGLSPWFGIPAAASGYVISVDKERLIQVANDGGFVVRMESGTGDFVIPGQTIAAIYSSSEPSLQQRAEVDACYVRGRVRTVEQDSAFGIQQIVDVALKALSPGINDQTTAVMCVDRLTELLVRIADRKLQYRYHRHKGVLRLIAAEPSFDQLLNIGFGDILRHAIDNTTVLDRLHWAMQQISAAARKPARVCTVARLDNAIVVALRRTIGELAG